MRDIGITVRGYELILDDTVMYPLEVAGYINTHFNDLKNKQLLVTAFYFITFNDILKTITVCKRLGE